MPASVAPERVFESADALGDALAERLVRDIETARRSGARYLLGCPTGRTPRPLFAAMARRFAASRQDVRHLVLVMMDEYLVRHDGALAFAPAAAPWSCHHFARVEIVEPIDAGLPHERRIAPAAVWFPDPRDPAAYDARIAQAGGIDFFVLASGASDGHVAFNPPGSARDSVTRVIELSESTRRDNLQTFPTFGTLDAVPHYGLGVGVATIARARAAAMLVTGAAKGLTLARMRRATGYEPGWPATLIHECAGGEIWADAAAAGAAEAAEAAAAAETAGIVG